MSLDILSVQSELGPWPKPEPRKTGVNEKPAGNWVTLEPAHHSPESVSPQGLGGFGANVGGCHVAAAETAHTIMELAGPVVTPVPVYTVLIPYHSRFGTLFRRITLPLLSIQGRRT